MARQTRLQKPLIYVFCEGESEQAYTDKWDDRLKIINKLRKLRKRPNIRIRLLMTSGCIEYWLMLHYRLFAPSVQTVAEKERMISELKLVEPAYLKGNKAVTTKIAQKYLTAIVNAEKTVKNLLQDGLPGVDDTDERNKWLCKNCRTFSNVYEGINYLESFLNP